VSLKGNHKIGPQIFHITLAKFLSGLHPAGRPIAVVAGLFFIFSSPAKAGSWTEHESKLRQFEKVVSELEAEIQVHVRQKHHAKAAIDAKMEADEIISLFTKLRAKLVEQEELVTHARFKHPERSDAIASAEVKKSRKNYFKIDISSSEQIENELGLDGRLTRLKSKILAVLPIDKKIEAQRQPASAPATATEVKDSATRFERVKLVK
jgi:hypothetical protein